MSRFTLFVPGRPVPQGSKTAFVSKSTGRPIVVDKDVRLPQWRMKITAAAMETFKFHLNSLDLPLAGPVGIVVDFYLDRPKGQYLPVNRKRTVAEVNPTAPRWPATMPDLDKLLRAIFDALTDAHVWLDDGQVVWVTSTKRYADPEHPAGVRISLGRMNS